MPCEVLLGRARSLLVEWWREENSPAEQIQAVVLRIDEMIGIPEGADWYEEEDE